MLATQLQPFNDNFKPLLQGTICAFGSGGCNLNQLLGEFKKDWPGRTLKDFADNGGFSNELELLRAFPDIVRIETAGNIRLFPVRDEDTANVVDLIDKTNLDKRSRVKPQINRSPAPSNYLPPAAPAHVPAPTPTPSSSSSSFSINSSLTFPFPSPSHSQHPPRKPRRIQREPRLHQPFSSPPPDLQLAVDWLCDRLNSQSDQFNELVRQRFNELDNAIKGVRLKAYHSRFPIDFVSDGLTRVGALQQRMAPNAPPKRTVALHFAEKNTRLQHPEWPCCIQKVGSGHESYFPIELMYVVPPGGLPEDKDRTAKIPAVEDDEEEYVVLAS